MLSDLKAGIIYPPQLAKAAEQVLINHHATDQSMKNSWQLQQMFNAMANQAFGNPSIGMGNGWQQQGRQQIWRTADAPQGKTCCRCGGSQHHQSQCHKRTDGTVCQKCNKPGHTEKMCRSKGTPSTSDACKCCGKNGHVKKECPFVDMACEACNKMGHTIHVCRKAQHVKTSLSPTPSAPTAAPTAETTKMHTGKAAPVAVQAARQSTDKAAPVAVPAGEPWWNYRCRGCFMGIRDPDLAATVCPHPGCTTKAPNAKAGARKDATTTAPTTAFNSTFSKAALETERRIGEAGPGGDLALSLQDQQTVKEMKELQDIIAVMRRDL